MVEELVHPSVYSWPKLNIAQTVAFDINLASCMFGHCRELTKVHHLWVDNGVRRTVMEVEQCECRRSTDSDRRIGDWKGAFDRVLDGLPVLVP